MIGDFADFVSRLQLTAAGVIRSVAADPQKAAENLAKSAPSSRLLPEPDHRKKITPEQALTEAMLDSDGHKLAELLAGQESSLNSQVWRDAANKPLPYRYVHKMFGVGWCEYWARRTLAALIRSVMWCLVSAAAASAVPKRPCFFLVGVSGTEAEARSSAEKHGVHFKHGRHNFEMGGAYVGRVRVVYESSIKSWSECERRNPLPDLQGDTEIGDLEREKILKRFPGHLLFYQPWHGPLVWVILRRFIFWSLIVGSGVVLLIV